MTEIQKIKSQVESVEKKIDRVLSYLENDSSTGRRGLYTRVNITETKIKKLEFDKRFVIGFATAISVVFSSLVTLLVTLFKK